MAWRAIFIRTVSQRGNCKKMSDEGASSVRVVVDCSFEQLMTSNVKYRITYNYCSDYCSDYIQYSEAPLYNFMHIYQYLTCIVYVIISYNTYYNTYCLCVIQDQLKLSKQIQRCYAANRRSATPFQVRYSIITSFCVTDVPTTTPSLLQYYVTSYGGQLKAELDSRYPVTKEHEHWDVSVGLSCYVVMQQFPSKADKKGTLSLSLPGELLARLALVHCSPQASKEERQYSDSSYY